MTSRIVNCQIVIKQVWCYNTISAKLYQNIQFDTEIVNQDTEREFMLY